MGCVVDEPDEKKAFQYGRHKLHQDLFLAIFLITILCFSNITVILFAYTAISANQLLY